METKLFTSLEDFLKSKPNKERTAQVLNYINKQKVNELRQELYGLDRAIRWFEKTKADFAKHGLKLSPENEEAYKRHTKERAAILNILPPPRKINRKVKAEVPTETTTTEAPKE